MSIVRYSPLRSLSMFDELGEMDKWFNSILPEYRSTPAMDVTEDEKAYQIKTDVPGFNKEDIKLSLENNILTIEGEQKAEEKEEKKNYIRRERRYSSFKKSVQIYDDIDIDKINASMKNGILELTLPKIQAKKIEAKKIEVQ